MRIEKIIVIQSDAKTLMGAVEASSVSIEEENTLYVLRLNKNLRSQRLYAAACASGYYGGDWEDIPDRDNKSLLNCLPGTYTRESGQIPEQIFTQNEEWITRAIEYTSDPEEEEYSEEDYSVANSKPVGSELFDQDEEIYIKNRWGSDLLTSVKKLDELLNGKRNNETKGGSPEAKAQAELRKLVAALKTMAWLEQHPINRDATNQTRLMASYEKDISDAAVALKEQLKLTDCWEIAKKWMYRIIGAILLAVPSAMLGLKAGPGGAVAGGAVGGYAGYKFGNRIGNYFSPVRAKSDHANVISAIVHKNISRSK